MFGVAGCACVAMYPLSAGSPAWGALLDVDWPSVPLSLLVEQRRGKREQFSRRSDDHVNYDISC